jgi:hypothetical protein
MGLVDRIVFDFVDMGVFVLSLASYFNQMFCGVHLLCGSPKGQVFLNFICYSSSVLEMAGSTKVGEDGLNEEVEDVRI